MDNLDLRVQKTYRSLIESFELLLHEKEFEKISVTEICEAAMIRRPTFYRHFLDKYDFLTFFIKHKMSLIFDYAYEHLNEEEDNFFILAFEQLLDQYDNILYLIFSLQMNPNVMVELMSVQEYGQKMLKNNLNDAEHQSEALLLTDYKAQTIMGLTIQSVYWYKRNKDKITRDEMIQLYKEMLAKF